MLNPKKTSQRNFEVDVLRGFAIVLMVIFHFGYDLTVFGWASYNTSKDIEWKIFRALIVSSFLLAVGMSSYLAYHRRVNKLKLAKATGKLVLVAAFLTMGSLYMHPNAWVYFGIIHLIAIALPVSVLFVRVPYIAVTTGILILLGYWSGTISMYPLWLWSVENMNIPTRTVDLASFVPWIGVVLIGIFVMHKKVFYITVSPGYISSKLSFLGKHSLLIYLVHQLILYGILTLVALIFGD